MAAGIHAAVPQHQLSPSTHHPRSRQCPTCMLQNYTMWHPNSHVVLPAATGAGMMHAGIMAVTLPKYNAFEPCVDVLDPLAKLEAQWLCGLS